MKIKDLIPSFSHLEFHHIFKEFNVEVDNPLKKALLYDEGRLYYIEFVDGVVSSNSCMIVLWFLENESFYCFSFYLLVSIVSSLYILFQKNWSLEISSYVLKASTLFFGWKDLVVLWGEKGLFLQSNLTIGSGKKKSDMLSYTL